MEEMEKLRKALDEAGIEWTDHSALEPISNKALTRTRFFVDGKLWSVVHGRGTYGGIDWNDKDHGLLEAWQIGGEGSKEEEPEGWLTAEQVLQKVGLKNE